MGCLTEPPSSRRTVTKAPAKRRPDSAHVQLDRRTVHHMEFLDRNRGTTNPSDHQTAGNPLDPDGEIDRPAAGKATQRSVGLDQAPGAGVTRPARPGRPTCGLPAACAGNLLSAHPSRRGWS
jgi:hypothetical protein